MTNDTVIDKSKLIKKAKKLLALAKRGVGGEKDNAKVMLDKFLEEHGISIDEIDVEANLRKFPVVSKDDYTLLTNIILSVNPFAGIKTDKGRVLVELDSEDYKEVKNKHKYFTKLWNAELDLLVLTFYTKNEKYLRPDEYAYNKHSDNGKKENSAFRENEKVNKKMNKDIEKTVEMTVPTVYNPVETPKQKMERLNISRMQHMLQIMLNAEYYRGKE